MGKITVNGKAEREVSYDVVEMSLEFEVESDNTSKAVETVTLQCEAFLKKILELGISINDVSLGDNGIEQDYEDGERTVIATRKITLRFKFNMPLINAIMSIITEQDYNVSVDTNYHVLNENAIEQELLKEAFQDAKNKAEILALAAGFTILGVESVDCDHYGHDTMDWMCNEQERPMASIGKLELSQHLVAPKKRESKSVEVVWNIE